MNRKQFITWSGWAAAGLSALPAWLANPLYPAKKQADNWVWINGSDRTPEDQWRRLLERLSRGGFNGIACNGSDDFYQSFGKLCREYEITLHTWRWTLNRGQYGTEHPEWYTVNRNGVSVLEEPPYVGYYRWLCPSNEGVRKALRDDYVHLSRIPGVDGVHLDYVRYCDIYLPVGLQPKYNLIQDYEMPQFDYCYCEGCRSKFASLHGYDPLSLEDPSKDEVWHRFRLDQVVETVHGIVEGIHQAGSVISGAVFPTPGMSRRMVRQDWARFGLDTYMPMLYHSFYLEDTHWISRGIAEARKEVSAETPIYAGMLFGKNFDPKLLADTRKRVLDAGGNGLSVFTAWSLSDEHLAIQW